MPVQKKSAKLLRFNKFKLTSALMKKLSNKNNFNLNNNNELEKSNFDYTFKKESKISNSINPCEIPSTFEKQLELEEKEREKESRKENKKKSEQNNSLNLDKFHKNSSSLIIEKTEDNKKNKVEFNHTLKFFQKEIPYLKSEENKENGVNKDIENKVNKNISLEEKKQVLNLTPTNEKTYKYNGNKYYNKKKKICLCCIPII